MQVGLIGLGKMGANMRQRWRNNGVTVIGHDRNKDLCDALTLDELAAQLTESPRVVWVMVPAAVTGAVIDEVAGYLSSGDIIIDGGNSKWTNDAPQAAKLAERGIKFVDCGVSGGIWGLTEGYALMVGGDKADVQHCQPLFDALKPEGEFGFVHAGAHGAGHFTKMVHNGIEYGLMQSYAEGYEMLEANDLVTDAAATFASWRSGTVIRSWLLDLATAALNSDPELSKIRGYVEDSGEGRWTVEAAIELGVPVPAIAASLFTRFESRTDDAPSMKLVAAMRNQFGGHAVVSDKGQTG